MEFALLIICAIIRLILSSFSIHKLISFFFEVRKEGSDIYIILLGLFLISNIGRNVLYCLGSFFYIVTNDPTILCPTYAILCIANDSWSVILNLFIALSLTKWFLNFIKNMLFCCKPTEATAISRARLNTYFFSLVWLFLFILIMALFLETSPEQFSTSDFRCYAKSGIAPILFQIIGICLVLVSYGIGKFWFSHENQRKTQQIKVILNANLIFVFCYAPLLIRDIYRFCAQPGTNDAFDIILAFLLYISLSIMGALFVIYLRYERKKIKKFQENENNSGIQYSLIN